VRRLGRHLVGHPGAALTTPDTALTTPDTALTTPNTALTTPNTALTTRPEPDPRSAGQLSSCSPGPVEPIQ
jgi:hypothetical protein